MNKSQIIEVRPGHRKITQSKDDALDTAQAIVNAEGELVLFSVGAHAFIVALPLVRPGPFRSVPDTLRRHWIVERL